MTFKNLMLKIVFQVYLGTSIMTNLKNLSLDSALDEKNRKKVKNFLKIPDIDV